MEKSEIKEEILSEIKIDIDETLFYIPGETIKGTIKLSPGFKLNIKDNILNFKLKLLQYEFWEYTNIKVTELKNVYKTEIEEKIIKYQLKEEESTNYEENEKIGEFSAIKIEKEPTSKIITIPFEFKLDEENEKLLPTFQYETDKYFLGIRHLLTVENIEYTSLNHIGLFIGKYKNIKLLKKKEINNTYYAGLGTLDAKVILPKQSYYFGEEMPFEIEINSNLHFKKVTEIKTELSREIEWVGFMTNSLLDKKTMPSENLKYNKDSYKTFQKLTYPILFVAKIVDQSAFNSGEISRALNIIQEVMRIDGEKNEFKEEKKLITQFNDESLIENCNEKDLKKLLDEFKQFIYFKDDKIVGFVKFVKDITPPVKGYYFNCNFVFKIKIYIAGMILDQEKWLETNIDFYDGEEEIKKMKEMLKV